MRQLNNLTIKQFGHYPVPGFQTYQPFILSTIQPIKRLEYVLCNYSHG